jgi:hypothetical protein
MRVRFHPEFPNDVRFFAADYSNISPGLGLRFSQEIDDALVAIKESPTGAGHFLSLGPSLVPEFRRRNLRSFPFFILYGLRGEDLIIGSVIPSRSDPLRWLTRFAKP